MAEEFAAEGTGSFTSSTSACSAEQSMPADNYADDSNVDGRGHADQIPLTVAIVDDAKLNRMLLQKLLSQTSVINFLKDN